MSMFSEAFEEQLFYIEELRKIWDRRATESEDPMCKSVYRTVSEELRVLLHDRLEGHDAYNRAMPKSWKYSPR